MKRLPKLPFKPLDFAALGISLLLTVVSGIFVYGKQGNVVQVVIHGGGRSWVYPIDAEEIVDVPGPLGTTTVCIKGGEAWVEDSPCDNKTCVAAGHIHEQGFWIACLPNDVFVTIEGSEEGGKLDVSTW